MLFGRSQSAEEVERQIETLRHIVQSQAETIRNLQSQLDAQEGVEDSEGQANYEVSDEEIALVRAGEQIAAIKAYRKRTGRPLTESKAAITAIK